MKILFDQGTPVPLGKHLTGHDVVTAFDRGWGTLKNGELLDAAESEGFQLLITTDSHLKSQQNLASRSIAVIVLLSASWPKIQPRVAEILAAVNSVAMGSYLEIEISS